MINVVWQSYHDETPTRDYWDMAMLEAIFARKLWNPVGGFDFNHCDKFGELPADADGAVVVIPARHHNKEGDVEKLNNDIAKLSWVVIILVGDEEAVFESDKIAHPNYKLWVMTPNREKHEKADHLLINGWTPDAYKMIRNYKFEALEKPLDWFFAGQVTHERREQCAEQLRVLAQEHPDTTKLYESAGFTQGLDHEAYYQYMAAAKFVPCPSGAVMPDSFRVYEALEAGCIPFVDGRSPNHDYPTGFWQWLFNQEPPFPVVDQWESFPGLSKDFSEDYQRKANKCFAWWQAYKRKMVYNLEDDINTLRKTNPVMASLKDKITVLVPTSPIPSHPSTEIIEETISTIRHHLPDCEILIMIDGIREQQLDRKDDYEKYKQKLLWLCNNQWTNVLPVVFDEHNHQASMTKKTLDLVRTPLLLFVEHDTPIVTDYEIEWDGLADVILQGEANFIRLHHEALVLPEHEPLMIDSAASKICGVPLRKTIQWSQRPHLASAAFYRRFLDTHFSPESRTMIEDKMHGVVLEAWDVQGIMGWYDYRLMIYTPEGNIKRSYNLDGRKDDPKYDMTF